MDMSTKIVPALTGDEWFAHMECVTAQANEREISDGCARTIASQYHDGQWSYGYSFASTGRIGCTSHALWHEMFGHIEYDRTDDVTRLFMDMMGTYLIHAFRERGNAPVDGWSRMWVTGQN